MVIFLMSNMYGLVLSMKGKITETMFIPDQLEDFIDVEDIVHMKHNYQGEWTELPQWNAAKLILLAAIAMRVDGLNVLKIEMNDGTVYHVHTTRFHVPQEFLDRLEKGGSDER